MAEKIRVVHYLNQFFAQIGGEEKADIGPGFKEGPMGPGRALQQTLGQQGEVVATCFCGDNYFAEHLEKATEELLRQMANFKPQLLIAGPAFESGRYGVACGAIGQAAQERLGICRLQQHSVPRQAGFDQAVCEGRLQSSAGLHPGFHRQESESLRYRPCCHPRSGRFPAL